MGVIDKLNRFNARLDADNAAILEAATVRADEARAEAETTYEELLGAAELARSAGVPAELIDAQLALVRQSLGR